MKVFVSNSSDECGLDKWLDMLMHRCFDASEKKLGKTVQRKSEIIQVWKKMVLGKMILGAVQGKKKEKYYWITVL